MKKALKVLCDYAEDLVILAGVSIICGATFRLSVTAGLYAVGFSLIAIGAFVAQYPPRKR